MPAKKQSSLPEGFRDTKGRDDWPLGHYLREHRGKMSMREAARRAGVNESWWRVVEVGQQQVGALWRDVSVKPQTVTAMARAVDADPAEALRLAGYEPANFGWLLEPTAAEELNAFKEFLASLSREEREDVLAELQRLHLDTELKRTRKQGRSA